MKLGLLALAVLCGLATGLELHPGGALTPEETAEVAEARSLHEAALFQAADDDNELVAEELFDDEDVERQLGPGRFCPCFLPQCRQMPHCRYCPFFGSAAAPVPAAAADDEDDDERQLGPGRFCPCFLPQCRQMPHCRYCPFYGPGAAVVANDDVVDVDNDERQFPRPCPCFLPRCCRLPQCRLRPICRRIVVPLAAAAGAVAGPVGAVAAGPRVPASAAGQGVRPRVPVAGGAPGVRPRGPPATGR